MRNKHYCQSQSDLIKDFSLASIDFIKMKWILCLMTCNKQVGFINVCHLFREYKFKCILHICTTNVHSQTLFFELDKSVFFVRIQ